MGSDHGDVDDLGSGWLEVKKVCSLTVLVLPWLCFSNGAVFCWTNLTVSVLNLP